MSSKVWLARQPQTEMPARKGGESSPLGSSGWLIAMGVLAAAMAVYLSAPNGPQLVKRMKWENQTGPLPMTEWLSNNSAPVVLLNTPFDSWKSTRWTFKMLAKFVPSVTSKRSKKNVFKYHAVDKPFSEIPQYNEKKTYKQKKYTGRQFFHLLTDSDPDQRFFYYASGDIELLHIDSFFTRDSLLDVTFGDFELGQVNFWFGGRNVTAYTHYDTSHNLHTIIRGRKKFLLFPPSAHKHLKLYPSLHTFYRQVQVDILNLTLAQFRDLLFETPFLEVVLTRGETLYIPPYWFHCVVTLEPTISLNVWSQSENFLTMEDVYSLPIPFEELWGRVKLMRVLHHFVTVVLQGTLSHYRNISSFMNGAVLSRYDVIFDKLSDTDEEELLSLVKVFCLQSEVTQLLDNPSLRHVNKGAMKVIDAFKSMLPLSVREINIANYLEHVAWRVLGTENVILVPFYYKKCFSF